MLPLTTPTTALIALTALLLSAPGHASAEHDHAHDHDDEHSEVQDDHAHAEERIRIAPDIAAQAGIRTAIATGAELHQRATLYGKAATEHSKISHLKARFPGLVLTVEADIGEQVERGQVLASIESNRSLLRYTLKAPFDGTITARHANPGELADGQTLFTLADYSQLWVELQAFPQQAKAMRIGQTVQLEGNGQRAESSIQHLIPSPASQPFLLAGVPLDNSQQQWLPGTLMTGHVTTAQLHVPLAVDKRALQQLDGETVVFIKHGDEYTVQPLTLGRSDSQFSEVLGGLHAGDEYVVENSYLLKADLEKSGAEHVH
ncbi:MAG: hypothetical protein CSA54_02755 [Gammaproteobacteria bacterium]|nr:MAG: hypothetical protein CSA54_02755 [Gammaproteobacteria bacterium]